jgi:hypothetical protein
MNLQPYSKLLTAYPHLCYTLGYIPASNLTYATPPFWISKEIPLPRYKWSIQTIAVWNTAARLLNDHNSTWIKDLANDILEATWNYKNSSTNPYVNSRCTDIETGFDKFGRLPLDQHHTNKDTGPNQETPVIPTQTSP